MHNHLPVKPNAGNMAYLGRLSHIYPILTLIFH